jgi:Lon protease-like protein
MTEVIRINFARPMPVLPLPDDVLLPHAIKALHIFEPRYRQMINEALDHSGQIGMATFAGDEWKKNYFSTPSLRPVVCIGQMVKHETLPDGRHNILLHGVCRARIERLIEPSAQRLYRLAVLRPVERVEEEPPAMDDVRVELRTLLDCPYLKHMRCLDTVLEWFDRDEISTHSLLELLGFAVVRDTEIRYRLLEEADPIQRARILKGELSKLSDVVCVASKQSFRKWPKGASWN